VRVIGGSARGRKLLSPPRPAASGRHGTRPTSDLIRGVIFDMLDAMGASYDRVLDLYAGSGALGIEALSRGDGTADFVESDAGSVATIAANLALTGFQPRAKLLRLTAELAGGRLSGPYTLVLADPPYYDEGAPDVLRRLAASPLVDEDTVLVFEHHRRRPVANEFGRLMLYRSRRHGDTVVSIYWGRE